ncbi:MAG TPA: hypothetical protein VFG68_00995 [Fimbriiglobus sp.]|nr:hypothetical protein [Fimbriiglobus sp.]
MDSQPQPAPMGTVTPPPTELCTNCQLPGGGFIVTTVADCQAQGGTPVGSTFPCEESDQRSQQLKEREQAG